jgi:hypothetical protein
MTEPLPPLPEPFAPAPRPLRRPGCGRGALIGCGALIALFGLAAIGLSLRANEMLVWILKKMEAKVEARLPADLTPHEKERLRTAFADLYRSIGEGRVQPTAVQGLQREIFAISGDVDRGLSREQVLHLATAVEEAAGNPPRPGPTPADGAVGPPAPAATPAPSG